MKKRVTALMLGLILALSLTACGGQEPPAGETQDQTVEDIQTPEEPDQNAEVPETPEEEPAEDAADGEGETPAGEPAQEEPQEQPAASVPAAKPETGKPAAQTESKPQSATPAPKPEESKPQTPAPAPAPAPEQNAAEQKPAAQSVDLTAFVAGLASGQSEWPAMMDLDSETLSVFYPGLSDIATNQCVAQMAMISAVVAEVAVVEVQNADDVQKVKDIFQARINYQVGTDENPGAAMYPATIEGWQNGSRIVSNGNYVMLIVLGEGADSVVSSFNALFA